MAWPCARLEAGAPLDLENEQVILKKMLLGSDEQGPVPESDASDPDGLPVSDCIRYALTAWLDEAFLRSSPVLHGWTSNRLEMLLYGSRDASWKFWNEATEASARAGPDLEVFFLCVMLGFRGDWGETPAKLADWIHKARERLTAARPRLWQAPAELEPPTDVPPLRGLEGMHRMVFVCGMSLMLLIPLIIVAVARQ